MLVPRAIRVRYAAISLAAAFWQLVPRPYSILLTIWWTMRSVYNENGTQILTVCNCCPFDRMVWPSTFICPGQRSCGSKVGLKIILELQCRVGGAVLCVLAIFKHNINNSLTISSEVSVHPVLQCLKCCTT